MRRAILWSTVARDDYIRIIRHIANANPDAALRVADRLERSVAKLAEMATGRPGRVIGTYEKPVSGLPYIVAYEIIPRPQGGEAIAVLHTIHGARDWPAGSWPPPD